MANIIVVFPKTEDAKNICAVLRRRGYSARGCTGTTSALQLVDELGEGILICGYKIRGMQYDQLYELLPPSFNMLLIASAQVIEAGLPEGIEGLETPLRTMQLTARIDEMTERLTREKKRLHGRASRSSRQQEIVTTAKTLLMERHHWTEPEAHRYLQKTSMDSGRNITETSAMIVSLMTIPAETDEEE